MNKPIFVVIRHHQGDLQEFRLFHEPEKALKIKVKMEEIYPGDKTEMIQKEVE